MSDETFRWVIAGGVILAALSFIWMAIASVVVLFWLRAVKRDVDPLIAGLKPAIESARETLADLKPKLRKLSANVVEVSNLLVEEAHRYSEMSKDFAERASAQIARLDVAVDDTVERVQEAGGAVRSAVLRPVREIDGLFYGVRTAISTFARGKKAAVNSATQDEELFI